MKKYFDKPTQVKFIEFGAEAEFGGIAFQDYIICGCCGGKIMIDEWVEITKIYNDWVDLSEEIIQE